MCPDALGDIPFPGEALGCAMNIFSRSRIQKDEVVSVIGSGFLGTMLIRLAKAAGARVFAFSRRESSLSAARDAGADEIISLIRENPQEKLAQFTDSKGCDCVIECAGKEDALNLAARLCGTRGRIVVAGYHQDGFRQVDMQLWNWKGLDIICAHERDLAVYRLGVEKAINAVLAGDLQPDAFYTHRFPFSELKEALELQAEAPEGFIKALVIFE